MPRIKRDFWRYCLRAEKRALKPTKFYDIDALLLFTSGAVFFLIITLELLTKLKDLLK